MEENSFIRKQVGRAPVVIDPIKRTWEWSLSLRRMGIGPPLPGLTPASGDAAKWPVPNDLLQRLQREAVRYLVVGGMACALHGHRRATFDVDILVATDSANVERLLAVLATWGDGRAKTLLPTDFTCAQPPIHLEEDYPLVIYTMLNGQTFEDLFPRALRTPEGIVYLSLADLIAAKQTSARDKDQFDVIMLRQILARQRAS